MISLTFTIHEIASPTNPSIITNSQHPTRPSTTTDHILEPTSKLLYTASFVVSDSKLAIEQAFRIRPVVSLHGAQNLGSRSGGIPKKSKRIRMVKIVQM